MTRKTIILIILNISAAIAIGICAGIWYKYFRKTDTEAGGNSLSKELLYREIAARADSADARIGVAVISSRGDTLVFNDTAFPMLSVVKFHQALAVCHWLKQNAIPLDAEVTVTREMLKENTWSPLRDSHPDGGRFSYRDLLTYALETSDNNACDILFGLTGGPGETSGYIRSLGISGFDIVCTEDEMHEDLANCYRNWSTPLSAVLLLEQFRVNHSSDEYLEFVWETMTSCGTGQARIPAGISSDEVSIAHKTGTGDYTPDSRIIAVNDIGVVLLPDGSHFSIAVFVSDAACPFPECEKIIADITGIVYDSIVAKGSL